MWVCSDLLIFPGCQRNVKTRILELVSKITGARFQAKAAVNQQKVPMMKWGWPREGAFPEVSHSSLSISYSGRWSQREVEERLSRHR